MVNIHNSTDILRVSFTDTSASSVTYTTHSSGLSGKCFSIGAIIHQAIIRKNKLDQIMMGRLLKISVRPVVRQLFYHRIQWK